MSENWLSLYLILALNVSILLGGICYALFRRFGRKVLNFRGLMIPTGYGFVFAGVGVASGIAVWKAGIWPASYSISLMLLSGVFGILGFVDDCLGQHGDGGMRGHFKKLLKGKVTTGAAKAIGGLAVSLIAAWMVTPDVQAWWSIVINALVIALFANFLNLMDMRPGRASSIFLICCILLVLTEFWRLYLWAVLPVALAVILMLKKDRNAGWIMGDSGSNVLGALIGLCIVLLNPLEVRLGLLAFLIVVHAYSEKRSISKLIDSSYVLRSVDRLFGVRS